MAKARANFISMADEDYTNYLVARLALWAGDSREAYERLAMYRRERSEISSLEPFLNLAAVSADRTLRQFKRRTSEYKAIYRAAEISPMDGINPVLRSSAGHLAGVIWVNGDREFELRAYLLDLLWEPNFYRRIERLIKSQKVERPIGIEKEIIDKTVGIADEDEAPVKLEWIKNTGSEIFLQIAASPFCTLTARGVWMLQELPLELPKIISPFQTLLNDIDPKVT